MKITVNIARIERYFRQNFGVPLVIIFQLLLVTCAAILIERHVYLANKVAVYAYYFLVIGVVLQLITFL